MRHTRRGALALLIALSLAAGFLTLRERAPVGITASTADLPAEATKPIGQLSLAARGEHEDARGNPAGVLDAAGDASLSQWMDASGYGLMSTFIAPEAASLPGVSVRTDYQSYDAATLRALADQGDPAAAFYYAMNPGVAHGEAVAYFESALVNGAFPVAAFQAALRFDSIAIERDPSEPFYERLQANPGREMQADERSYLLWLATAAELNDPLSQRLLETQILPLLDAGRRESLRAQAAENLRRLNDLRASRNLPSLTPVPMPAQAQRYIQEQYFDRSEAMLQQMRAESDDDAARPET